jgi:hypothetical protein
MADDILEKLENFDITDELLDGDFLLNAVGIAAGPAGMALITAVKQAKQMYDMADKLTQVIGEICDDPNNTADASMFSEKMRDKLTEEQKAVMEKVVSINNSNLNLDLYSDGWA